MRPRRARPLTIGRAVPAAAVRVLRRLRRLRRDALRQAAQPALRRPHAGGQRHRLLLDLRRQPADHALDDQRRGRGPAWSNSLFEDNAEFGLGFRLTPTSSANTPASCSSCCGPSWTAHRRPGGRLLLARAADDRGRSPPARRVAQLREALKAARPPRARQLRLADGRPPRPRSVWIVGGDGWAYDIGYGGLDHVLASGATSTSWCWTPRCTPTPAARPPSPPRAARWPSSRPAASRPARRTSADGDELRQRLRRPVAWAPTRQTLRRSGGRGLRRARR
jgi:hypothetical protein